MPRATTGLIDSEEREYLSAAQVHEICERFAGGNQLPPLAAFGFGRDLVDRAEGVWLYLRDGRRVLDFAIGALGHNHGHNHPRIIASRSRFARERRMEVHKTYFSPYVAALGHNLAHVLPADLTLSFFPNSGAEAVEGAVKLAYKYHSGRRHTILRSDVAQHGSLLGSGGLSAGEAGRFPSIPGVVTYRYGDLESARETVASVRGGRGRCDVYALLVEPFSAATLRECSEAFLRGVRRLCTAEDIVLVFDEVGTGWGRTGSLFHFMRYSGLVPDVLVTGPAFGGGKSSISAYVAREPVFRAAYDNLADSLAHSTSTTYYGFGEENATAIEAVNIAIEDDYSARARSIEAILAPGLAHIAESFPGTVREVRGRGASFGILLDCDVRVRELASELVSSEQDADPALCVKVATCAVAHALYHDHDIHTYYSLDHRHPLIIAPPLVAEREHLDRFLNALAAVLGRGLPRLLTTRFLAEKGTTPC